MGSGTQNMSYSTRGQEAEELKVGEARGTAEGALSSAAVLRMLQDSEERSRHQFELLQQLGE